MSERTARRKSGSSGKKAKRGFAAMSKEKRRAIAAKGGRAGSRARKANR